MSQSGEGSKRILCGVLGILLNIVALHRFMLGDTKGGLIRIALNVVTCGGAGVIGLVEGIIYLTKSDEEFDRIYVQEGKAWF